MKTLRIMFMMGIVAGIASLAAAAKPKPAETKAESPTTTEDLGTICYRLGDNLMLAKGDGSKAQKVLSGKDRYDARISPTGDAIAYTADEPSKKDVNRRIEIYDVATQKARTLSAIPGDNTYGPLWSPDGKKLMFRSYSGSKWNVAIIGTDNNGFTVLSDKLNGKEDLFCAGWWAPDSKSCYLYDFTNVYHVGVDGKEIGRKPLAEVMGDIDISSDCAFDLAPDGKTLIFSAEKDVKDIADSQDGPPTLLWQGSPDGGPTKRLSPKGLDGYNPAILKDGKTLLFNGGAAGGKKQGIYRMNLETKETRMVIPKGTDISATR